MNAISPSLDISIVTFNSINWLDKFFNSLINQNWPTSKIRLIVRDNGSTDETLRCLYDFQYKYTKNFNEFLIDSGSNIGFGRGHNKNLEKSKCGFFLVTNVDLEFEVNTITNLMNVAEKDVENVALWECRQKPFEHPKVYNPVNGYTDWSSSACALFRTSALKQIGGYEPRLFLYGEDVEISYRLRDFGYCLRYIPQATVWHYTYEYENQVKPQQFLGSTLAHILLRCRYGNLNQILIGIGMYLGLFLMRPRFSWQRWMLLKNLVKIFWLAPNFLFKRKKSQISFGFRLWDYALTRDGSFYHYVDERVNKLMPLVSVIIRTTPGRSGKLKEALASLLGQTYTAIQLVLVEDGGNTAQHKIDDIKTNEQLANIIYLPLPKSGRCIAGNVGLQAATGELVCFLDDDDLFYADHIEVLVSEWLKNPNLGAVYGLAYQVRTEVITHEPWNYKEVEYTLFYKQSFNRGILWHHNYLPIQTVLFQRKLYLEYGGFDPDLDNLEDWNLWVRYSLNYEFLMVPKVTSIYRVPAVAEQAANRQHVLDDYYLKAQAKHAELKILISPPDVIKIAESISSELFVAGIPISRLRCWALNFPIFKRFYHPLRKAKHLFNRLRQH